MDSCLVCKGDTYPALLMYQELANMAGERITAGILQSPAAKERPIQVVLDAYNPTGSTSHVKFNTSEESRWETDARRCHINWVILDSDWEAEFCRVAEAHPKVRAYVKNHNLGLEVPYRWGSEMRKYLPDFVVLVDDGRGRGFAAPGSGDQGISQGRREGEEGDDGHVLGAGGESFGKVRAVGICGIHGRVSDPQRV